MKLASTDGAVTRTVVKWRRDLFGPLIEERLRPNDRYSANKRPCRLVRIE
jgi:hypothetical protein